MEFIPNWKRLGLKSVEEGISHILSFLKKEEKVIANAGFGEGLVKDGNGHTLLEFKGDSKLKEKRKKQTIHI